MNNSKTRYIIRKTFEQAERSKNGMSAVTIFLMGLLIGMLLCWAATQRQRQLLRRYRQQARILSKWSRPIIEE
jgi:uncharacterized membrane protein SpoIIM required for sporulation